MLYFLKRHKLISSLALAALLVAGVSYFVLRQLKNNDTFAKVEKGTIVESVYGIGTIKSSRDFQLKVGIPSVIENILVSEGQFVKKGEPLIILDGQRRHSAPFSGVVTQLFLKIGETVFPQTPILTLTDYSDRYLVVSLEQKGALRALPGQSAQINFESIRDQKFMGTVTSVYSNPSGFLVRIDVSDLPKTLLPGMSADVSIAIKTHENVLLVPVSAIDIGKVYVRQSDFETPLEKTIQTGIVDANMAQVLSGDLKEGDFVRIGKGK